MDRIYSAPKPPAGRVGKRIYSHTARQRDYEFESHQGNSLNPNQMNKYERLKNELASAGNGKMKAFGNSMLPILKSGSLLTFVQAADYKIGDIVFCKVKGRYIDAHKIVKSEAGKGFLIANNHGFENGWTKTIFGKVVRAEYQGIVIYGV
jgi:hypothetical protein